MVQANMVTRITQFSQALDVGRRYLTDGPTPSQFAAILKNVDAGDVAAIVEIAEEMEAKDSHLQAVVSRRRESLTALEWSVVPDPVAKDQAAAKVEADYVDRSLRRLESFPRTLEHYATAIGPGIAVSENVWFRGRLVDTVDVPGHRLSGDILDETNDFYMLTDDDMVRGIPLRGAKFVVHVPDNRAGFPMRVSLTRAQAQLWLIKHYAIADWSAFSEVYGQPVRVAKYSGEISPKERKQMEVMLKNMGTDLWAMFSDNIDVTFLEAARNNQPFQGMVEWIERKQSILYLGQTLTTEQGGVGSLALGKVHEGVKAAIALSDIQKEKRTVEGQIIKPMLRFRFPNSTVPRALWQRNIAETRNIEADASWLAKFQFMKESQRPVDDEFVYDKLGIPLPKNRSV